MAATVVSRLLAPAQADPPRPTALLLLLPAAPARASSADDARLERALESIPSLSLAILSSRQGSYTQARMYRDIAVAERLAKSRSPGAAGLLARVPGPGGLATLGRAPRSGGIDTVARAPGPGGALDTGRLQVARLPSGRRGLADLRGLVAARRADQLILALQSGRTALGHELLWAAAVGLGPGERELTSQTTEQRGLIAAIDVVPTLLAHLKLPIPADMRGHPVRTDGALDGRWLRSLKARLEVVYPRRLPALGCLLAACALVALLACAMSRSPRRPAAAKAGDERRGRLHRALRVDALAILFAPTAMLLPAALEPGAASEYALIALVSLSLAALTDALVPWPRAPLAPALAAVLAFSLDALVHTKLLIRSLLGPNPAYGSRFYGIGNELKSALAVLVFAAVAAALYRARRSRRAAAAMTAAGGLLAVVEGSARLGAGVGGVVLVCAGTVVATALLLPSRPRRALVLATIVASTPLGLGLLAGLDLATAHGSGHFTGSVLDAGSVGEVWRLVEERYEAAWEELGNGLMPLATVLAVLASVAAVRYRERLLAVVAGDPAWLAALAGGLTAGLVGTLSEDSGPLLLVSAVSALACVLAYLWGSPELLPASGRSISGLHESAQTLGDIGYRLYPCASVARWLPHPRRAAFGPGCKRTASPG